MDYNKLAVIPLLGVFFFSLKLKLLNFLLDSVFFIYLFIYLFNYSFIYLSKDNFTNKIGAMILCFIPSISFSFGAEEVAGITYKNFVLCRFLYRYCSVLYSTNYYHLINSIRVIGEINKINFVYFTDILP